MGEGGAHETHCVPALGPEQLAALEQLYRTTRDVRLRTRAQIVLLAAEQRLTAPAIAGSFARARRPCAAGSSAGWPRGSRGCATRRARARRAR